MKKAKEVKRKKSSVKKPAVKSTAGKKKTIVKKTVSKNVAAKKKPVAKSATANKKPIVKSATVKKSLRKNVSLKTPNGRTIQTRDEYFEGQKNYRKLGYEKKGLYRKAVVVDSNRKDELAVVKLTTSKKGKSLDYKEGKSKYRPFVLTKDDKGKPIKLGSKFVKNSPKADVSKKEVNKIKKDLFRGKSVKTSKDNRKKVRELKGRR